MLVCPTNFVAQVVISAKEAQIVQDRQQRCEQSDKKADAFRRGGLGLDVHLLGRSKELEAHRLLLAHLAPCPGLLLASVGASSHERSGLHAAVKLEFWLRERHVH